MTAGHPALILPYKTSEFAAMVNALSAHHNQMRGDLTNIAAALRGTLPGVITARGGARGGLMGADARVMAYLIVKPLMQAATLDEKIARLYTASFRRYQEHVVNIGGPAQNTFQVDG